MTYQRFSKNCQNSNNSHIYTETEALEPSEEDIEEFARRIGIDPKTEPHLLYLARDGLMVKLPPDWKPCKDSHRDAWYYYNNQTHLSQWEHPMDPIYRDKVIQARSDHAMNRIQNFDLHTPKPLKTLPPLKKGGGAGLNSFPSTLTKLGPLKNQSFSSSEDLSQFSSNSLQRTGLQPLEPLIKKPSSLAPLTIPTTPSANKNFNDGVQTNFDQEPFGRIPDRPKIKVDPPPAVAPAKKSGLTLTGAGASFLKSAKATNSNTNLGKIDKIEETEVTTTAQVQSQMKESKDLSSSNLKGFTNNNNNNRPIKSDLTKQASEDGNTNFFQAQKPDDVSTTNPDGSLSDTSTGKPLKSILVNSSLKTRSRLDEKSASTTSTKRNLWEIIPSEMTDEEHNQWDALDFKRDKPSVKFHLEDPKLVFEIPSRDSDDQDETEDSTEEEEEESEEVLEEESDEDNETKRNTNDNAKTTVLNQKPLSYGDGKFMVLSESSELQAMTKPLNSVNQRNLTYSEGITVNMSQNKLLNTDKNEPVVDRQTIKLNMEVQLKEYQLKIEEENQQQRQLIKSDMEKNVVKLKSEMKSVIERTKEELEIKKKGEIDKARVQMETTMMSDLEKIGREYKEKLEAKKKELATAHNTMVKSINAENEEKLNNTKNNIQLAEAGKEFEKQLADEIKQLKATMTAQHEKQVEDMKALHRSTIQKLKLEFQTEEEKLKKEHANFIAEMFAKFDTEKQNLVRSFEMEQDKIKQEFSTKAARMTEELNENLELIKKQFEDKNKTTIWPSTNPNINSLSGGQGSSNTDSIGMRTNVELKQTEHELSNLRLKYKSLEEKYNNLKKGVHNVVVNEKAKLDKSDYSHSHINLFHLNEDEQVESSINHHSQHIENNHLEDVNNTVDSGAAESDIDTSLSLSSIGNHKNATENDDENGKTITKLMTGSNDRLSQVLTALEDLKKQMLEIKSEQRKIGIVDLSDSHFDDKDDENIQILHQRQGSQKKKSSVAGNVVTTIVTKDPTMSHVSEVRVPRARVSRSALDSSSQAKRTQNTKMVNSTNEMGRTDNGNGRNYMDDFIRAKDFIKSEKYRLKRPGLSFGTPVSTSLVARQRPDYKLNTHLTPHNNNSHGEYCSETQTLSSSSQIRKSHENKQQSLDHHSETESSGVGSWKEGKMEEKSKIGQDIEGILTSLQQLDGQMKYLWSVVGGGGGAVNTGGNSTSRLSNSPTTTPIAAPLITSNLRMPQNTGQLLKAQIPMTIPLGNHLQQQQILAKHLGGLSPSSSSYPRDPINISELEMKYNLSPNFITPGNQALINSINAVNSSQFRRSLDISTNPVLTTLEEHVNNIRNRQSRILQQYPSESNKRDKSPSISEKTKDLREWLEKF